MCGRHSLHVFCLGILLATIGRLVINEFLGGALLQCVVLAAGIAIMIGIAALMDWFNAEQRPSSPQVLRASATDEGYEHGGNVPAPYYAIACCGRHRASSARDAPAQEQDCAVPTSFYDTEPTLPKTAAAIASGQTI